ncbi:hypothetical protein AR158_C463R [Paramecium bursaria Chlorella virus AR158]|uniref:hypothetical protein n=1 Tax=Paramecium bursaria Chlorella virus AR158 TaxID=380598 RepID=UPI00015AA6ED|nr:hypothetical protein AR158_C463R [Paramecium bursaria Chlorella virus AR158]ABU44008.1 hypothetical protein AR158_C463R [Paramecium bursaria Chlorella virus AR158]
MMILYRIFCIRRHRFFYRVFFFADFSLFFVVVSYGLSRWFLTQRIDRLACEHFYRFLASHDAFSASGKFLYYLVAALCDRTGMLLRISRVVQDPRWHLQYLRRRRSLVEYDSLQEVDHVIFQ